MRVVLSFPHRRVSGDAMMSPVAGCSTDSQSYQETSPYSYFKSPGVWPNSCGRQNGTAERIRSCEAKEKRAHTQLCYLLAAQR